MKLLRMAGFIQEMLEKLTAEGYLKITGRVKDIFKTTKGEYISPSTIEMKLSEIIILNKFVL